MTPDTVLIVTASYDTAAEYVIESLIKRGTPVFRLNTDQFPSKVKVTFNPPNISFISEDECTLHSTSIKSVWYRRHVLPELPAEMEVGVRDFCEREARAFLEGALASLPVTRWMSSPQAIARAERKPYQLTVASRLGFTIPDTVMTNDQVSVLNIAKRHKLATKAISSGYISYPEGNRAIFTNVLRSGDLDDLRGLALAPVTFQEFVDKLIDIRVTVVADEVFTAEILSQENESSRIDWRATNDPHLLHREHTLPTEITNLCRELVKKLGLAFGAIDLALKPDGTYIFFEINPNGQWLWIEDQLGFPISDRIAQWLN